VRIKILIDSYFQLSKKSNYALRALFELAWRGPAKPVNVRSLAESQDIPVRFLEIILNELKQGRFVLSIRGKFGGYLLARKASEITVAQIIRFIENPPQTPQISTEQRIRPGAFVTGCIMQRINQFIGKTCDCMTLQDMVDEEMKNQSAFTSNYMI